MQKIINVLAISSFAISLTVVGGGVYLYTQKDAIIDGVKSKVMKSVMPSIGVVSLMLYQNLQVLQYQVYLSCNV